MWQICVPLLSKDEVLMGKKQHCFEIPTHLYVWPPKFRRPDPPLHWWTVGEKVIDVAQDLQILASLSDFARDLSPEFERIVQAGIEQAAYSIKEKLPEGVELNFREQTTK